MQKTNFRSEIEIIQVYLRTSILWLSSSSDSKQPCGMSESWRPEVSSRSRGSGPAVEIGAVIPRFLVGAAGAASALDHMAAPGFTVFVLGELLRWKITTTFTGSVSCINAL